MQRRDLGAGAVEAPPEATGLAPGEGQLTPLRLPVDGAQDHAIFLIDPEGRILTWNAGAERVKGFSAAP